MMARLSLLLGVLLLVGFSEPVPAPRALEPAAAATQGRELVAEILSQKPEQDFTTAGILKIRTTARQELPILFQIKVTPTNWVAVYQVQAVTNSSLRDPAKPTLRIGRVAGQKNQYEFGDQPVSPEGGGIMVPFAGSDFWLADLGLEFFHWPDQKILKSELRKTRLCRVLESVNPQPATNGYARVVSWIDDESRGILHAEAYDSQNRLLKEFDARKFKKVRGEWQLEQMEMYNVQTRSRTQIEFNFDSP